MEWLYSQAQGATNDRPNQYFNNSAWEIVVCYLEGSTGQAPVRLKQKQIKTALPAETDVSHECVTTTRLSAEVVMSKSDSRKMITLRVHIKYLSVANRKQYNTDRR